MLELDGQSLALSLGHNHIVINSGSAVSDQAIPMILEDNEPLFQYPFDAYEVDITISANIVNATDPDNVLVSENACANSCFACQQLLGFASEDNPNLGFNRPHAVP